MQASRKPAPGGHPPTRRRPYRRRCGASMELGRCSSLRSSWRPARVAAISSTVAVLPPHQLSRPHYRTCHHRSSDLERASTRAPLRRSPGPRAWFPRCAARSGRHRNHGARVERLAPGRQRNADAAGVGGADAPPPTAAGRSGARARTRPDREDGPGIGDSLRGLARDVLRSETLPKAGVGRPPRRSRDGRPGRVRSSDAVGSQARAQPRTGAAGARCTDALGRPW